MMMKRFFRGTILVALIAVVLCARPSHAFSDADEIALGKTLKRELSERFGPALSPASPLSRRVARIGARFARLSTRHLPYSYRVLDSSQLNAFAVPGGSIFITRRLAEFCRNDAELASVLGHETGHLELRHAASRIEGLQNAQKFGRALGEQFFGRQFARSNADFIQGAALITYALWSRGYSRAQESRADDWGVHRMAQLGYDPRAVLSLFARVNRGRGESVLGFLASHPPMQDREARLNAQITREKLLALAQRAGGPRLWDALKPVFKPALAIPTPTLAAPTLAATQNN